VGWKDSSVFPAPSEVLCDECRAYGMQIGSYVREVKLYRAAGRKIEVLRGDQIFSNTGTLLLPRMI